MEVREYRLALDVDFSALSFEGRLEIEGASAGAELTVNANGLSIRSARAGGTELSVASHPERQEVVLGGIPSGTEQLRIDYAGSVLTDGLVGLYRSSYGSGYILTSQFAPAEARRVLPCLDRPDQKAVFRVSVTVPRDLDVIFNTPSETVVTDGARKTIHFAPTPKMAPYLLYFAIGRFDTLHGATGNVKLAIYAPPGRGASGAYALDVATRVLPAFERYYGIPYPLPKLDLVAVPEFWAGAMENWGAISFSEMALLADRTTSALFKRTIAESVTHEIAHMWFGNLVTMAWWSDIWLNESFATFMSYRILDRVFPAYDSWSDFLPRWSGPAFLGDSLESTHPIYFDVKRPDEINQIFDEISYGKGASVLRMLEQYLGEEPFRRGINAYLVKFQYSNARHEDLWQCLEEVTREPVRRIMEAWIHKPGVPVLFAHVDRGRLIIEQKRYRLSGQHSAEVWPVPLLARIDGAERRLLLDEPRTEIPLASGEPPFLNVGASGFFRVRYDSATLEAHITRLDRLSAFDQWTLVHDLGPLVVSNDLGLGDYLRFLSAGRSARHYLVAQQYGRGAQTLYSMLYDHPQFLDGYRAFLRAQTDRLGLARKPEEPVTDGVLREEFCQQRAWVDPPFARELAGMFDDLDRIDPDLRSAVAVAYARTEGVRAYDPLLARFRSTQVEAELLRLLGALTAFADPELVERVLAIAERREMLLSLVPYALLGATRNPSTRTVGWNWLRRNLESFAASFRGSGWAGRLLETVVPRLGLGREKEVEAFLRSHPVPEGGRGLEKGLELLAVFSAFRSRETSSSA